MGVHRGWRVEWKANGWLAQAWNPSRRKYESKRFSPAKDPTNDRTRANEWARRIHLAYVTGRRVEQTTERTAALGDRYLKALAKAKATEDHRADVGRILTQLATEAPDVTAPGVAATVEEWIGGLAAPPRRLAIPTRNRYLHTIKAFGAWLVAVGALTASPFAVIDPAALPVRLPDQLGIDELRKLTRRRRDRYWRRFVIELYLGLRESEANALTWVKVDLSGRVVDVIGKGNKQRLVPIPRELADEMKKWKRGGLVCPLPTVHTWREFQAFLSRAKVPRNGRSPHTLRHCYAGLMTATGVPSILLAAYMGHTSTETTAGYAGMATRYVAAVTEWKRGEFELMG